MHEVLVVGVARRAGVENAEDARIKLKNTHHLMNDRVLVSRSEIEQIPTPKELKFKYKAQEIVPIVLYSSSHPEPGMNTRLNLYILHFIARTLGIQLNQVRSHKTFILFFLLVR